MKTSLLALVATVVFLAGAHTSRASCDATDSSGIDTFYFEVAASILRTSPADIDFKLTVPVAGISADDNLRRTFFIAFKVGFSGYGELAERIGYQFRQDCIARTVVEISPFPFSERLRDRKIGKIWADFFQQYGYDDMGLSMAPDERIDAAAVKRVSFFNSRPVPCGVDVLQREDDSVDVKFWISIAGTVGMEDSSFFTVVDAQKLAELAGRCALTVLIDRPTRR